MFCSFSSGYSSLSLGHLTLYVRTSGFTFLGCCNDKTRGSRWHPKTSLDISHVFCSFSSGYSSLSLGHLTLYVRTSGFTFLGCCNDKTRGSRWHPKTSFDISHVFCSFSSSYSSLSLRHLTLYVRTSGFTFLGCCNDKTRGSRWHPKTSLDISHVFCSFSSGYSSLSLGHLTLYVRTSGFTFLGCCNDKTRGSRWHPKTSLDISHVFCSFSSGYSSLSLGHLTLYVRTSGFTFLGCCNDKTRGSRWHPKTSLDISHVFCSFSSGYSSLSLGHLTLYVRTSGFTFLGCCNDKTRGSRWHPKTSLDISHVFCSFSSGYSSLSLGHLTLYVRTSGFTFLGCCNDKTRGSRWHPKTSLDISHVFCSFSSGYSSLSLGHLTLYVRTSGFTFLGCCNDKTRGSRWHPKTSLDISHVFCSFSSSYSSLFLRHLTLYVRTSGFTFLGCCNDKTRGSRWHPKTSLDISHVFCSFSSGYSSLSLGHLTLYVRTSCFTFLGCCNDKTRGSRWHPKTSLDISHVFCSFSSGYSSLSLGHLTLYVRTSCFTFLGCCNDKTRGSRWHPKTSLDISHVFCSFSSGYSSLSLGHLTLYVRTSGFTFLGCCNDKTRGSRWHPKTSLDISHVFCSFSSGYSSLSLGHLTLYVRTSGFTFLGCCNDKTRGSRWHPKTSLDISHVFCSFSSSYSSLSLRHLTLYVRTSGFTFLGCCNDKTRGSRWHPKTSLDISHVFCSFSSGYSSLSLGHLTLYVRTSGFTFLGCCNEEENSGMQVPTPFVTIFTENDFFWRIYYLPPLISSNW